MTKIKNKLVLVTGAASGLGKLFTEKVLKRQAKGVVLWDINEKALNEMTADLERKGYKVYPYVVDVSNPDDITWAARDVLAEIGTVDILFNNAGIVVGKTFAKHSDKDITKTIDINVLGVMRVAKAFLPAMIDQQRGHIVNMASAAGLIPNPNMSVYAASKWAVIGWSESLRLELEEELGELKVLTVMPSYINTGMFDGVKPPLLTPILEPDDIVNKIIDGIEKNIASLKAPFVVKTIPVLKGFLPKDAFDYVAGRIFGVYSSMDNFKGRKEPLEIKEQD